MDFYATLLSNASPDVYKNNKTSHFKVRLPERLDLHGEWQVALLRTTYPNTLTNVQPDENWIKVITPTPSVIETHVARPGLVWAHEKKLPPKERTFYIAPGHYPTNDSFLKALKDAILPIEKVPGDKGINSVVEIVQGGYIFFHPFHHYTDYEYEFSPDSTYEFSPILARLMGLAHEGPFKATHTLEGKRPVDLTLGIPTKMFIYMDIVKEQIVGHTMAPLLNDIPVDINAKYGSMTCYKDDQAIYYDLNTKSFDTVGIDIRTDAGRYMPFEDGTLSMRCHFKPRKLDKKS